MICGGFSNKNSINKEFIKNVFNNYENVFLETCMNWQENYKKCRFDIFVPLQSIVSIVNSFNIDNNYIGIHIRRGDNVKSQEKSPIILFINKINDILKDYPNQKFYLATDSLDVKDFIVYHFGNNIIKSINVELSRNSETGIIYSLVEMMLLSRCSKIFGSYWSSFDEIAACFSNIKVECVLNK